MACGAAGRPALREAARRRAAQGRGRRPAEAAAAARGGHEGDGGASGRGEALPALGGRREGGRGRIGVCWGRDRDPGGPGGVRGAGRRYSARPQGSWGDTEGIRAGPRLTEGPPLAQRLGEGLGMLPETEPRLHRAAGGAVRGLEEADGVTGGVGVTGGN